MATETKDAKHEPTASRASAVRAPKHILPKAPHLQTQASLHDLQLADSAPLSLDDYRSLLELSGAETAFFRFDTPPGVRRAQEDIVELMWRYPARCHEANRRFAQARNLAPIDVRGRSFAQLFPRNELNTRAVSEWARSGFHLLRSEIRDEPAGRIREISIYGRVEELTIISFWIIIRDLTEAKDTLLTLKEAEEHYRTLVERPGLILIRRKPSGEITYVTPHVKELLDFEPEEFRVNPDLAGRLVHPDDRERYHRLTQLRCEASRKTVEVEYRVRHKDGSYHWLYERQTPKIDIGGVIEFYDSLVLDIQERKQLELQLLHSQRMDTLGSFAQGMAHEFNNGLAAMLGQIGLGLRQLDPNHPGYAPIAAAEQAALRCAELTNSLLNFGNSADTTEETVNVAALLEDTLQLLLHILPSTIETSVSTTGEAKYVRGNYAQLQQALINLAVNARDAMPGGGSLIISSRCTTLSAERQADRFPDAPPGNYVEISLVDTGPGISAGCLPYIFDPFFSTKRDRETSGLGLSTVYSIVKAHQGAIRAANVRGGGSVFTLILPLLESHTAPGDEPALVPCGTETILVAEDDAMVLQMVKSALSMHGYRVITAADGSEAVDAFRRHGRQIRLALIDQTMPKLTGRQVLNELCTEAPDMPIILTSGYGKQVEPPAQKPSFRFLSKPYRLSQLLALIRQMLDQH